MSKLGVLKDLNEFCNSFNIVENAMNMRTLVRWNGRDLRNKENLAEHTHLVVACSIELYDELSKIVYDFTNKVDFERLIRLGMLHDSLEMLRGDILSITKNAIPHLRELVDCEEEYFISTQIVGLTDMEKKVGRLADLMACYKFVENELRFPSSDYMIQVYKDTKSVFDNKYNEFIQEYAPDFKCSKISNVVDCRFKKGYKADAGTDIVLLEDVDFMPMQTVAFGLKVNIVPKENEMAVLCSRTSAAAKGLIVAMCPIDPYFTGEVTAIVHNMSNEIITYHKGDSFCQFVTVPICTNYNASIKKEGTRSVGKLGSTDK